MVGKGRSWTRSIAALALLSGWALAPCADAEEGGGALDPSFMPMAEIAVPIIDGSRIEGVLRFTLVLRARDAAGAAEMVRDAARLRAVAVGAGLDFARLRSSPYRAVDCARLADSLDVAFRAAIPGFDRALIVKVSASPQ